MPDASSLRFVDRPSTTSTLIKLAALAPAFVLAAGPAALLASSGAAAWDVAQGQPLATVNLGIGLIVLALLAVVPAVRLVRRLGFERTVEIRGGRVITVERSLLRRRSISEPIHGFDGICHVVRTSLSGSRHELMLVDIEGGRRVVFHAADRIGRETIDAMTARLGLAEIAAADLVRWPSLPMRTQTATV